MDRHTDTRIHRHTQMNSRTHTEERKKTCTHAFTPCSCCLLPPEAAGAKARVKIHAIRINKIHASRITRHTHAHHSHLQHLHQPLYDCRQHRQKRCKVPCRSTMLYGLLFAVCCLKFAACCCITSHLDPTTSPARPWIDILRCMLPVQLQRHLDSVHEKWREKINSYRCQPEAYSSPPKTNSTSS